MEKIDFYKLYKYLKSKEKLNEEEKLLLFKIEKLFEMIKMKKLVYLMKKYIIR